MGMVKHLTIVQWNVKGLKSKLDNEEFMTDWTKFHICIITETGLTMKINVDNVFAECVPAVKVRGK